MITTKNKIRLARLARRLITGARAIGGKGSQAVFSRGGLRWDLDLNEGIDFAIYLLGGFELNTRKAFRRIVRPGMTVVDIGANIGAHTLPLAAMVGDAGRVIAVEPTDWAFRKLRVNLSLNPQLEKRVSAVQAMLVGSTGVTLPESIYSSWPLTIRAQDNLHPVHLGCPMSTRGAVAVTLDDLIRQSDIQDVDVIKLDVDGFELGVLQGAQCVLRANEQISIIMELAPYLFNKGTDELGQLFTIFQSNGLALSRLDDGSLLPMSPREISNLLPHGASMNVLVCRK
jgi:FkbM family methyltransferase